MNNWTKKEVVTSWYIYMMLLQPTTISTFWIILLLGLILQNLAFKGLTQVQKMACHSLRITQQELEESHKSVIKIIWLKFIIYTKHP